MRKIKIYTLFLYLIIVSCGLKAKDSILEKYNVENSQSIKLTNKLKEISGLVEVNGNIFCHNDESGIVYNIDVNNGEIIKEFYIGNWEIERDFEGITFANNLFYLITSDGILYEFPEGKNREKVKFKFYKLGFSSNFEIEGLCYNKNKNSLIIACKDFPGKKFKGQRAFYSYSLKDRKINKKPEFLISLKKLEKDFSIKNFYPSGVAIHPINNSYIIISSKGGPAIAEISKKGKLIFAKKLDSKTHKQPEGITFLKNNKMVIGDEGGNKKGQITIYDFID